MQLPTLAFAFLFVGIMRLIAPWKLIRIGEIWSTRIGHLIGNTECYLCERDDGRHPGSYDIFFHIGKSCNKVVSRKYDKRLHIWPTWLMLMVIRVNCLFQGWERHTVKPAQVERDIYGLWQKHAPHIGFTGGEHKRGQKLLRNLGMPEGAKWVCLIVRDSGYLRTKYPNANFSYHDYRDADIIDYSSTALALVERGYYVLRMGEIVNAPMMVKHSKVIDYAGTKYQSAFADLYLGAHCAFCLGTPTGFMMIPQAFGRPLAMTDFVPIEYFTTSVDGLIIWKHHMKDERELTIPEIMEAKVSMALASGWFQQAGVTLKNNTPQEIHDVAMEMMDEVEDGKYGKWPTQVSGYAGLEPADVMNWNLQQKFWDAFPLSFANGQPLHGQIKVRIGREYLKAYAGLQNSCASRHQG